MADPCQLFFCVVALGAAAAVVILLQSIQLCHRERVDFSFLLLFSAVAAKPPNAACFHSCFFSCVVVALLCSDG